MIRTIAILAAIGGIAWVAWSYANSSSSSSSATDDSSPQPDPSQPNPWSAYTLTPQQQLALSLVSNYPQFEPAALMAIIQIESGFDPNAYRAESQINDASYGLMQVLYGTAQWVGYGGAPDGLYDPATNVQVGVAYLSKCVEQLQQRFGTWSYMTLCTAYNEGIGNALQGRIDAAYYSRFQGAYATWSQALAVGGQ